MGDTVSVLGFEARISALYAIAPQAYTTSSSAIASSAIDTRLYPRKTILAVFQHAADATSTGVTCTVTESAVSGSGYASATIGTLTAASTSARTAIVSVKRNPAKPYIKITMTPAGGSGVVAGNVFFQD